MDIEHIKMLKHQLEQDMLREIRKFEAITGTTVANIKHACAVTVGQPMHTAVIELNVYVP
jgi:hypothetical protein